MKTFTVKVTTKHYKTATRFMDIKNCPLAKALKEKFPDSKVGVGGESIKIDDVRYLISDSWAKLTSKSIDENIIKAKEGKKIKTVEVSFTEK